MNATLMIRKGIQRMLGSAASAWVPDSPLRGDPE
jgi:hypothetical protein